MPSGPRISLAVVTRDRASQLERFLLPSLRALDEPDVEVLIVDQSDGDETERLVRDLPHARYLRSAPGLSRGRNVAVDAAGASLIAFTDDDVEFPPGWLGTIANVFEAHPDAGGVCGRGYTPDGQLLPGRNAGTYRWPENPFGLGSGFNLAFRREALAAAGRFDEELGAGGRYHAGEDSDMLYRVLRAGWSVVCRDEISVVHHQWRSRREELRIHYRYGLGAGAQTAGHAAAGDRHAARIARREAWRHVATLVRSLATLRFRLAAFQVAFLAGLGTGFVRRRRAPRPVPVERPLQEERQTAIRP